MRTSKGASALFTLILALLIVSFSVSLPILFRPFYYLQMDGLGVTEATGLPAEHIRTAYDELLDYCAGTAPFRTGALSCSPAAQLHFEDVRWLFRLDFVLLGVSALLTAAMLLLRRSGRLVWHRFWGRGPGFWAGGLTAALFLLVSGLAALNFDAAFTAFHLLFFPGADNWILDPVVDSIVLILPEVFFRNCAILIVAALLCCCVGLVAFDLLRGRRKKSV